MKKMVAVAYMLTGILLIGAAGCGGQKAGISVSLENRNLQDFLAADGDQIILDGLDVLQSVSGEWDEETIQERSHEAGDGDIVDLVTKEPVHFQDVDADAYIIYRISDGTFLGCQLVWFAREKAELEEEMRRVYECLDGMLGTGQEIGTLGLDLTVMREPGEEIYVDAREEGTAADGSVSYSMQRADVPDGMEDPMRMPEGSWRSANGEYQNLTVGTGLYGFPGMKPAYVPGADGTYWALMTFSGGRTVETGAES